MNLKPYLKYIYEVLAIVIGITLSFMVDEWREERQNREIENTYLINLRSDLVQDTSFFTLMISRDSQSVNDGIKLRKVLYQNDSVNNPENFIVSTQFIGRLIAVEAINTTFVEIQNSGMLKLIKNDSLRRNLIAYHEDILLPTFNGLIEERVWKMHDHIIKQLPFEYFLAEEMDVSMDSLDYEIITSKLIENLSNPEFEFVLKNSVRTIKQRKTILTNKKNKAIHLLNLIDEELKK